jgi:predicted DNA-binding protein (UPF0251 family)
LTAGDYGHILITVARPFLPRRVCCSPEGRGFRPIGGAAACTLAPVTLALDELEAIRLADLEGLYQDAAAERMGVSRQTFARILARARAAVAEALVEGKMLVVASGPVVEVPPAPPQSAQPDRPDQEGERCPIHGGPRRRGRGCLCRPASP